MKIRKLKQAWVFCRMTKRGRRNYRQRVAYRKKAERMLTVKEANEDINQDK